MAMLRRDVVVLALIEGSGVTTERELRGLVGLGVEHILRRLENKGLIKVGHWSIYRGREIERTDDYQYATTGRGAVALKVALGRRCDWCSEQAVDGLELKRGATYIYFCGGHREIAVASAETEPSSKGSLYGQIRAGKVGAPEPDEAAA